MHPQETDVVKPQRFRHNAAITVAAVVAFFGTIPLATSRLYLLPLLLVPILVGVWAWRAGTDISPDGLRVRALFGSRYIAWADVAALAPADGRHAYAVLTNGQRIRLTAVSPAALASIAAPPDAEEDAA